MKRIYPTVEKVVELNALILSIIHAKKGDKAELLNRQKLNKILEDCEACKGDIFDQAAILLKELVRQHPFASGNRRTALITTKYFLIENKEKFALPNEEEYARILVGIREDYYSNEEIKEWIKHGKIRQFKR
ncbi:MAG TPA: type II toxin-antitoxin system death-on-curing family toxin [Candidatus Nanoarchaeia archaeon]|nr:type II toxin-antitoxin system death-on-curing family toxin [Candidatus Nanoarchaeia archaeon]